MTTEDLEWIQTPVNAQYIRELVVAHRRRNVLESAVISHFQDPHDPRRQAVRRIVRKLASEIRKLRNIPPGDLYWCDRDRFQSLFHGVLSDKRLQWIEPDWVGITQPDGLILGMMAENPSTKSVGRYEGVISSVDLWTPVVKWWEYRHRTPILEQLRDRGAALLQAV